MTYALIGLALLLLLGIAAFFKVKPGDPERWPYRAKAVMSQPEQVLYLRLVQAMPEKIVLAQVQMSRMLKVESRNNHYKWLNRINQKSVDFVVCELDARVLAAIELDDGSHNNEKRRKADDDKNKALQSANVRLIRWNVKTMPTVEEIKNAFHPPALTPKASNTNTVH